MHHHHIIIYHSKRDGRLFEQLQWMDGGKDAGCCLIIDEYKEPAATVVNGLVQ